MKRGVLLTIGWALVAAVIALSLLHIRQPLPAVPSGDKWGHLLAYFTLMYWFMHLHRTPRAHALCTLGFIGLGGALELLQSLTPHRSMEWADFLANGAGVLLALAVYRLLQLRIRWLQA